MAANNVEEKKDEIIGDCNGSESKYIKLISSDGHEFIIKREHALNSGTIRVMLNGPGHYMEYETNEIHLREIPSHVLSQVCMYLAYKFHYTNYAGEIPEFTASPELSLELMMAANFLEC